MLGSQDFYYAVVKPGRRLPWEQPQRLPATATPARLHHYDTGLSTSFFYPSFFYPSGQFGQTGLSAEVSAKADCPPLARHALGKAIPRLFQKISPYLPTTYLPGGPKSLVPCLIMELGGPFVATLAQIEANRRNALRSTGPRSPAGKARSAQNARRHGFRSRIPSPPPLDDPLFAGFRLGSRPAPAAFQTASYHT
jgi:hypothetical protein